MRGTLEGTKMSVDARELRVPGSGMTAGTDERKEGGSHTGIQEEQTLKGMFQCESQSAG